jgi:predicted PurR-regulated permease PerM
MSNVLFLLLVALTTIAFAVLVHDLLMPVFWATVLATVFHPVQRRYVAALQGRRVVASLLTMLSILLLVVVPVVLLGVAMSREVVMLQEKVQSGEIDVRAPFRVVRDVAPRVAGYLERLGVDLDGLQSRLSNTAVAVSRFLASQALAIGQNVVRVVALFFLMLYILFFFLRDGPQLVRALVRAVPLGGRREGRLIAQFAEVSRATLKGTLAVGLVQGALGGLLFWAVGIPAPVFWGAVMTVFAVLPAVGVGLVWAPAAVILLALGEVARGVVVLVVGTFVIGLVDNLLRPMLVGRDTQMPDYLVLLATLGGISVFGISGFVIGPLIAAFFLAVWEMFAEEHAEKTI